jgi:hypothetical protein
MKGGTRKMLPSLLAVASLAAMAGAPAAQPGTMTLHNLTASQSAVKVGTRVRRQAPLNILSGGSRARPGWHRIAKNQRQRRLAHRRAWAGGDKKAFKRAA